MRHDQNRDVNSVEPSLPLADPDCFVQDIHDFMGIFQEQVVQDTQARLCVPQDSCREMCLDRKLDMDRKNSDRQKWIAQIILIGQMWAFKISNYQDSDNYKFLYSFKAMQNIGHLLLEGHT